MKASVISFMSGKGGVGKTSIVSNIAQSAAMDGKSVLIFDNDLSLSNVDLVFGVKPKYTILDFINGDCSIQQLITKLSKNIYLIPAFSGLSKITSLSQKERIGIRNVVTRLEDYFDLILIDNTSGLSKDRFDFIPLSSKMVIIINNDILSLTDSFALMKALSTLKNIKEFDIITNKMTQSESVTAFMRLQKTSALFLKNSRLNLITNIPFNKDFITSLNNQEPLVKSNSAINSIFRDVSYRLSNIDQPSNSRNIYG